MSTETLEFPEIAEAPAMPRTDVAVAAAGAIDLKKLDLTAVALAQFGDWRAATAKLKADNTKTVLDLSTQSKIDDAISLRQRTIKQPLADARKVEKALKSKLSETSKQVGAELVLLEAAYTDAASPMTVQIDAAQKKIDDEKEADRVAKEAALQVLRDEIDLKLNPMVERCKASDMTAERIEKGIAMVAAFPMPEKWAPVGAYWNTNKAVALAEMRGLHAVATRREEDARIESLRAETELAAAEQRERDHQAAMAMQEIQGIQQQVIIAQAGRLGVRVGGTIECIRETLAETEAWVIDAERFGTVAGLAEMTKAAALIQIRALLKAAEERELEAAQARAAAQAAAEAASDAAQHAAGQAVNPGACAEAAPSTLQPVPGGTPATTSEANDDDESDRGCARRLAGEGDDCGPGQPGERDNDGRDDGSAEHGAGLLRALAPRTAHQGDADHADLNTTSGAASHQSDGWDDIPSCPGCGAMAGCCSDFPNCPGGQPTTTSGAAPSGGVDHFPDAKEMVLRTDMPAPIADPAAAADIAKRVVLLMPPDDEDDEGGIDLHASCLEFVRGFLTAFDGKFPTQPKEPPEWWATRRAEAEALLPRLLATTERSN